MLRAMFSALALLVSTTLGMAACNLSPPKGLTLTSEDKNTLKQIGSIIRITNAVKSLAVIGLFTTPGGAATLTQADTTALSQAISGLGRIPACTAKNSIDSNLINNVGPSATFLNNLRICFEERCS